MDEPLPTVVVGPPPQRRQPTFDVGGLIARTFSVWFRSCPVLLPLGALAYLPYALGSYLLYRRFPEVLRGVAPADLAAASSPFEAMFGSMWATIAKTVSVTWPYSAVGMVISLAWLGAVSYGVARKLAGDRMRVGEMLAAGLRGLPAVFAASLIAWLAMVATACLVAPALILLTGWAAVVPAVVVERLGPIAALRRSWALTRGYRWHVFAGLLVVYLAAVAGAAVIQLPVTMLVVTSLRDPSGLALPMALAQVAQGMVQTLLLVAPAVVFHGLRVAKEGDEPAKLGEVFA
jgi:hypothetical protein